MKLIITPNCCETMRRTRAIGIYQESKEYPPHWTLLLCNPTDRIDNPTLADYDTPAPQFCPFCAKALPGIEPRVVTSPVNTNEEDYCGSCHERNRNCGCLPPWAVWQPIGGDDLLVDSKWRLTTYLRFANQISYADEDEIPRLQQQREQMWDSMTESERGILTQMREQTK